MANYVGNLTPELACAALRGAGLPFSLDEIQIVAKKNGPSCCRASVWLGSPHRNRGAAGSPSNAGSYACLPIACRKPF
jgi:hypothetical protein